MVTLIGTYLPILLTILNVYACISPVKVFVSEYVEMMAPVAGGLNVLPREERAGLGYLQVTITVMKNKLHELLARSTPLAPRQPFVITITNYH
jgi:hypothetical protein